MRNEALNFRVICFLVPWIIFISSLDSTIVTSSVRAAAGTVQIPCVLFMVLGLQQLRRGCIRRARIVSMSWT